MGEPFRPDRDNPVVIASKQSEIDLKNTHCLNVLVQTVLDNPNVTLEKIEELIKASGVNPSDYQRLVALSRPIAKNLNLKPEQTSSITQLQRWLQFIASR